MKKLIVIMVLLIPSNVQAYEFFTPLSKHEMNLEAIFVGLTVIDWMQTSQFLAKGHKELNPILGEHPTQQELDRYIFYYISYHLLVTWALPHGYRELWQMLYITWEAGAIANNWQVSKVPNFALNLEIKF